MEFAPARARGLKLLDDRDDWLRLEFAPARACGLKQSARLPEPGRDEVRARAGAWIETPTRFENSVRPVRCDSLSIFQRILAGTFRIRYSSSTKMALSLLYMTAEWLFWDNH